MQRLNLDLNSKKDVFNQPKLRPAPLIPSSPLASSCQLQFSCQYPGYKSLLLSRMSDSSSHPSDLSDLFNPPLQSFNPFDHRPTERLAHEPKWIRADKEDNIRIHKINQRRVTQFSFVIYVALSVFLFCNPSGE